MRLSQLACVLLMAIVACSLPVVDATADERILRDNLAAWFAAANAHDIDALLNHYEDGAVLMADNWPAAVGEDAIRENFLARWETGTAHITGEVEEVWVCGA